MSSEHIDPLVPGGARDDERSAPPERAHSPFTDTLELVVRAQRGDDSARDALFARYYRRVRRVVRARMGRRLCEVEDPDDIVQNTFIAAMSALSDFEVREEAALIHWFSRIVEHQINDALKHHRASKRDMDRRVELDRIRAARDSGELRFEPEARGTAALDQLAVDELAQVVDDCIAELPHDFREAIVMRDHADASWAWIARELGRPTEAAARELYRRAQLRLMDALKRRIDLGGSA